MPYIQPVRPTIGACLVLILAAALPAQAADDVRTAAMRALPRLQTSAARFVANRTCMSCHHNALAVMTLRLADRRGLPVDATSLATVEAATLRELRGERALDDAVQSAGLADPTPNDSLLLMAAHEAGLPRAITTEVYARRIAHWQRGDGRWTTSDFRPPHSSSEFTATATAIRALRAYMPDELAPLRDRAVTRAVEWLAASWPRSTDDATFRLLGLVWASAPADTVAAASRVLLSMQRPDGGWPQLPSYPADAYSTGEALYALRAGGVAIATPEWQRGVRFLLTTQAADGTWRVRTRMISPATVSPPYFTTGFPYGRDEYLSYAGSCWAVMALLSSMPEASPRLPAATDAAAVASPSWMRTALFGPARELETLLDRGLDPDSTSSGGTTPLMAASLDAEKTRLLLARGATPARRGRTGMDALTIAASHVGTAAVVDALLAAGAATRAPEDVHVRRSPLVAAAMAGDTAVVQRLLAAGAPPSGDAIAEAVTFGRADIVSLIAAAGGSTGGVDGTGINLLHWATITNRAAVIPVLAAAGVAIDAQDDAGFTPLMYAATIDQGDTATLDALLTAGADRRRRNPAGRTALQQARRLHHADLVRALERRR